MYIETSARLVGDNAILESEVYVPTDPATGKCFTFWYHMFGENIGELVIYKVRKT